MVAVTSAAQSGMAGMRQSRVLVTGATGMVGSWLVKALLDRQAYVVGLIRDADPQSELYRSGDVNQITVVNGPLEDFATVERAINEQEIDTVFHLGAQTIVGTAHRRPLATFESNIRGTYNVLEACRAHDSLVRRVVIASSDKAYGNQVQLPYREDMPLKGVHPYEVSKSCADLISQAYHHTYGLPVAILRCGNIYGGGDLNWSRIVPGTIRSVLAGERPIIRSDGTFVRDYIYVRDVVDAYLAVSDALVESVTAGEAFNFSTESGVSVFELVRQIQETMGRTDLEPHVLDRAPGEIRDQTLSAEKARRLLGWRPRFSLAEGLAETVSWYERFLGSNRAVSRLAPVEAPHD
jgi:CDP-glucose 4,6-dehydratase